MGRITVKPFKEGFSFDKRVEESKSIIAKYPDRVPITRHTSSVFGIRLSSGHFEVIIERYSRTDLPEMEKKKFLVPREMSVGQFIHLLSSRLNIAPGKALFIFVKNALPPTASRMDTIYQSFKDEDGFLYMCYSSEKTFG